MSTIQRGNTTIHIDSRGSGPPLLALAPGGLRASRMETWGNVPIDPLAELSDEFRVVGMDQRNTGTSFGPITADDGWGTYAADQLAVMDELGIDRFAVIGMCIGGAFIMRLIAEAPERIAAAVALQPIGVDDNLDTFGELFDGWREAIADEHPEADEAAWDAFRANLFFTGNTLFSVADESVAAIETPMLVCMGDDPYHPSSTSRFLASTAPNGELIEDWKEGANRDAAVDAIRSFLREHADA